MDDKHSRAGFLILIYLAHMQLCETLFYTTPAKRKKRDMAETAKVIPSVPSVSGLFVLSLEGGQAL